MIAEHTDAQLAALDVSGLLRDGLAPGGRGRAELFAEGAVAAALQAQAVSARPRSVAFLADVVHAGGITYAAGLPEPLPGPEGAALVRRWFDAVTTGAGYALSPEIEEAFETWLRAVATVLEVTVAAGPDDPGAGPAQGRP
jgi:hypothetical protein